ncbi:Fis family transcriptional regulator, partial [Enterococcus faecalis]
PWFSYLFQQAKLPAEATSGMLQIQRNVTKELQAEWQFNLTKMFPDRVDCFSPSNNMYILVEEQSKNSFQQEEIQGIFLTLD